MKPFTHLHVHSQYSILDGACEIGSLIKTAAKRGMSAIAITDHGNMFGVKEFYNSVKKFNDGIKKEKKKAEEEGKPFEGHFFKPILGCEVYVSPKGRTEKPTKEDGKAYHHLILLAKNLTGYKNLTRLASFAYTEGFYRHPRIDKEILKKYSQGLICSSACLGGEIPYLAVAKGMEAAKEAALEFKEIFGEDYYLEIQRHKMNPKDMLGGGSMDMGGSDEDEDGGYSPEGVFPRQQKVNEMLLEIARQTGIKVIATNDVHFINAEDAEAHDHLICLSTGKDLDSPKRMRYTRQEYLKTPAEMYQIFADLPEACANTQEIVDKIEEYELDVAPVMPIFPIPEDFGTEAQWEAKHDEAALRSEFGDKAFDRLGGYQKVLRVKFESDYLAHLAMKGAAMRWPEGLTEEATERIAFELETIKNMGFPGYFLIVEDFIRAGRDMGVAVGPGRGSAAGAVVAYCLRITDIDPIKYFLLFERFLNPDRVSMPDIDIDFDEDGREKVLDYVVKKYGTNSVAHIITFGTMATKSSIKDVARVQKLELSEANRLCKLIPEKAKDLKDAFQQEPLLSSEKTSPNELIRNTLRIAETLEGTVRQTGIHACGVIICRDDLWEHIPISKQKDAQLLVAQFEGKFIEEVGMLKMDFLGLKTLSIIQDAVRFIKHSKGFDLDVERIPLDDTKTFELFSRGDTTALFQFESAGMKKYLRELKPNRFEDLIAMNALYRPGPLEYIPSFIKRKHGQEPIIYDLEGMEEYLQDTYGITVYQEQVMLLSQKLAGFTKGDADTLRKAMGKKQKEVLDKMKGKFIEGASKKGHNAQKLEKVWTDWEAFAQYAFNKSHSTCYAYVAYQTGYIKANYPEEYMAAVLSRNLSNMDKIAIFMDECRRMELPVMVPDVNESVIEFSVNKKSEIRFGLGAIKGVGEAASQNIIDERAKGGPYKDVFDFVSRVNLRSVNKRCMENLVKAGAFDSLDLERHRFFAEDAAGVPFLETLLRYGANMQSGASSSGASLFGDTVEVPKPTIPQGNPWNTLERLNAERELIGMYLSAHPLDDYKIAIKGNKYNLTSIQNDLPRLRGKEFPIAGLVSSVKLGKTKTGKDSCSFTLEDYASSKDFILFGKDVVNYGPFMQVGNILQLQGRVDLKWGNSGDLDFVITGVRRMEEVVKNIQAISLKIKIGDLQRALIQELDAFTVPSNESGSLALRFLIFDPSQKLWVQMRSRSKRVKLDGDFIDFLQEKEEIDFMVE